MGRIDGNGAAEALGRVGAFKAGAIPASMPERLWGLPWAISGDAESVFGAEAPLTG